MSPSRTASHVHAAVYLLHGADDNVVPSTEAEWLASELPNVKNVLVSHAFGHVEVGKGDKFADKWALVHFMACILEETESV